MLKKLIVLSSLVWFALDANADAPDTAFLREKEAILLEQHNKMMQSTGSEKKTLELAFRDSLIRLFDHPEAPSYPFDSLKVIGRVKSDDNKLLVYTWNIPQPGGFHNYYCILQYYLKKEKKYTLIVLNEQPGFLNKYQQQMATAANWPGALYYKVVSTKYKGQTYYSILGFDFNNLVSNRKIIEVLTFDDQGEPQFVPNAFIYDGKPQNRIVFEYNERVQMTLDYDEKNKMIVFDHLAPFKPSLQNQYQFYGPDLSYDAFIFKDGKWVHQKDISPTL
jgi:hypothetical protein